MSLIRNICFLFFFTLSFVAISGETTQTQELTVNHNPDEIVIGFNFKKSYNIEPQFTPFLSEDNYVYAVSKEGHIHCFNQDKDKIHRRTNYTVDLSSPPKFTPDGKVCFLSQQGDIIFLNALGEELASCRSNTQLFSPPVINDLGKVLFISNGGQLYEMEEEQNRRLLAQPFNPFLNIKIAFLSCDPKNKAYAIMLHSDNKLCCFDPEEKIFFGIFECPQEEKINPESIIINEEKGILFVTNNNLLYHVDAFGTLWGKYKLPCTISSPFSIDTFGIVSFGGSDERVYYLDMNKEEIWSHSTNGKIIAKPEPGIDGRTFFLNEKGYMCWNEPVPDILQLKKL